MKNSTNALAGAALAAVGAVASAVISSGAAFACDLVTAYRYDLTDATYVMSVNGVYLDHSEAPSGASGGGPFRQWLVAGENTLTFDLKSGKAEIEIIEACADAFEGETLARAALAGARSQDLKFFVETPPPSVWAEFGTVPEKGLEKAVGRLRKAVDKRDFEWFWRLHEGLRMTAEANGFPVAQMEPQMREILETGEVSMERDLIFTPVLGGRVWQVMTRDHKAPVTLTLKGDDWTSIFATGVFWTKIDKRWRIVGS